MLEENHKKRITNQKRVLLGIDCPEASLYTLSASIYTVTNNKPSNNPPIVRQIDTKLFRISNKYLGTILVIPLMQKKTRRVQLIPLERVVDQIDGSILPSPEYAEQKTHQIELNPLLAKQQHIRSPLWLVWHLQPTPAWQ